ncbi:MAG: hypothetical protein JNM72_00620 [Deltaproteobacteria bacterium]|jgi:hypothetical protein|nr:hypothetical protein [Deltaproteobacteria bacterium]
MRRSAPAAQTIGPARAAGLLALLLGVGCAASPKNSGSVGADDDGGPANADGSGDSDGGAGDGADGAADGVDGAGDGTDGAGDGTDGAGDGADGGDPGEGLTIGDPISPIWASKISALPGGSSFFEGTDAAMLDAEHALVVGQGGWLVTTLSGPAVVVDADERRGIRVASRGGLAAIATRDRDLILLDVADPGAPRRLRSVSLPTQGEDIAVDADRILVGLRDEGARLISAEGDTLGTIPVADAFAVALQGDRALVTDAAALTLWDIADPSAPIELTRVELSAPGRDLSWGEGHVAVGLGGAGLAVFAIEGEALRHQGDLQPPGAIFSVAIDGLDLWAAGWEAVSLIQLGAGPPVLRGVQRTAESAMGLAAIDGRAMIADWFSLTSLQSNPGLGAPTLVLPDGLVWSPDPELRAPQAMTARNLGPFPLHLSTDAPSSGWRLTGLDSGGDTAAGALRLAPGDDAVLTASPPSGASIPDGGVGWRSDDPDRASGRLSFSVGRGGLGEPHPEMVLNGFQWPDPSGVVYDLADQRGKIVLLVYFALF